jgi:hypothetical protein
VRYPRSKSGQLCQSGSEFGARCALSAGHGGDAGGWRPAQGRRENGARGFSELGADRGRCEGSRERFAVCSRHEVRGRWWQGDVWLEVLSDPQFKDWMKEQLIGWRNKYLALMRSKTRCGSGSPRLLRSRGHSAAVYFYYAMTEACCKLTKRVRN